MKIWMPKSPDEFRELQEDRPNRNSWRGSTKLRWVYLRTEMMETEVMANRNIRLLVFNCWVSVGSNTIIMIQEASRNWVKQINCQEDTGLWKPDLIRWVCWWTLVCSYGLFVSVWKLSIKLWCTLKIQTKGGSFKWILVAHKVLDDKPVLNLSADGGKSLGNHWR